MSFYVNFDNQLYKVCIFHVWYPHIALEVETLFGSQKGENFILQNWILTNFHGNIRVRNVKYSDFLQLIIKIHIKTHMKTVGTTLKAQGKPVNEAGENTCFRA